MNKKVWIPVIILLSLFLFLYGVAAGHYRLFPFKQLMELRKLSFFDSVKTAVIRQSGVATIKPAEIHNTSLQRLLVKEIPLQINPDMGPKYLSVAGNTLYIITTHGEFQIYNLESFRKKESDVRSISMNLEKLRESDLITTLSHFRVLDVHTAEDESGNHIMYVSHHRYEEEKGCVSFNLSQTRFQSDNGNKFLQKDDWETIYTAQPCLYPTAGENQEKQLHIRLTSGGNIISLNREHLLISLGDYGFDGIIHESLSGDPQNSFGKVVLFNKTTGESSVHAEGLRNSQGMYLDNNGTIWATDHGPQGGDELNIIHEQKHYGWPEVSYGIEYGNEPWPHSPKQGRHEGYEKPAYVWMNAVAPTEILKFEDHNKFKTWDGDLMIGTLKDQSLYRLRVENKNKIMYSERIELGHRIRDMVILPDGALGLITDGMVLIIIDDGGPVYEEMRPDDKSRLQNLEKYERLSEID